MKFRVLNVYNLTGVKNKDVGCVIVISLDEPGSFRQGDLIDTESGRWKIIAAEHYRPQPGHATSSDTFGLRILPITPIYTTPSPGWFELLGQPE